MSGFPMIQVDRFGCHPPDLRRGYDKALWTRAREVGGLFLPTANSAGVFFGPPPIFRAIGETAPVAEAIDQVSNHGGCEPIIEPRVIWSGSIHTRDFR